MLMERMILTKEDLAKYPFLREAAEYVEDLGLKVEDLDDFAYEQVINRAEERVQEAILYAIITKRSYNNDVEILSFPIAILIISTIGDNFLKRRYALAEAKRAYNLLKLENEEKILIMAKNFNWIISFNDKGVIEGLPYKFSIHFINYLKNATSIKGEKWKLINRILIEGNVPLMKGEVARLLAEEVRRYVEKKLDVKELPNLPMGLARRVEMLRALFTREEGKASLEEVPKAVVTSAFPPCVRASYEMTLLGKHIPHVSRFTLTSFLINVGVPVDKVIDLFRNLSDFNERMTRYQVEHIAGERGSRVRYIPPKCSTLRTYGVCVNVDEICKVVQHPLSYYKKKLQLK